MARVGTGPYTNFGGGLSPLDFLSEGYYGQNPESAYYNYYKQGTDDSPLAKYIKSRYGDIYGRYKADLPSNPNLSFSNFLQGTDLNSEFENLAPQQRGINYGRYAPPVKYIGF